MDIHERLLALSPHLLSPEEQQAAERHAAECVPCAEILYGPPEPVPDVEPQRPRFRILRLKAVIAVVAVTGFMGLGILFERPEYAMAVDQEEVMVRPALRAPGPEMPRDVYERKGIPTDEGFEGEGYRGKFGSIGGGAVYARGGGAPSPVQKPIPYQDNRKIIRNADIELVVDSFAALYSKITELVAAEKGHLAAESSHRLPNGKMEASLTMRIPPERFEAVIGRLATFGTILHQNIRTEDVTKAYVDLESRLKSKETLAERLRKILAEAKGEVKELIEAEVQLGSTLEQIEHIKGEIKYYDNLTGLSTIVLKIAEKDLAQPFEYVQTLTGTMTLSSRDPERVFAQAQNLVTEAGGQVIEAMMSGQNEGPAGGSIRARVDSEKYPALRESLRKLGQVTVDRVEQQKTARGGSEETPAPNAPLRKSQATFALTITSMPEQVTRKGSLRVEVAAVEAAYQSARQAVQDAGGRILDGSLAGTSEGMSASLRARVDADKFAALVERLKAAGSVRHASVEHVLPPGGASEKVLEQAEIALGLSTPPELIPEEHGFVRVVRDTVSRSWTGFLWSVGKMFVGAALSGPWLLLGLVAWMIYRRRRKKAAAAQPTA